ncbi:hypothetical protein [Streptomyces sp. NPDC057909]|uniref:hypothetical protein n=1 Tax=Streptomyces sp. NPDC057909 TaxID=3346277 RepID=UPI0036E322F5
MPDDIRQTDLREEPADAPGSGPELLQVGAQSALLNGAEDELAYPRLGAAEAPRVSYVLPPAGSGQEGVEIEPRCLAQGLGWVCPEEFGKGEAVVLGALAYQRLDRASAAQAVAGLAQRRQAGPGSEISGVLQGLGDDPRPVGVEQVIAQVALDVPVDVAGRVRQELGAVELSSRPVGGVIVVSLVLMG